MLHSRLWSFTRLVPEYGILRPMSFDSNGHHLLLNSASCRPSSFTKVDPLRIPSRAYRKGSTVPQTSSSSVLNERRSHNSLQQNRGWVALAGIDPKRSQYEFNLWTSWLHIVRRAYYRAKFDLTSTWGAAPATQKDLAIQEVKDQVEKDSTLMQYKGLADEDLIAFKFGRFHISIRTYLKKLLREGKLKNEKEAKKFVKDFSDSSIRVVEGQDISGKSGNKPRSQDASEDPLVEEIIWKVGLKSSKDWTRVDKRSLRHRT
ncbi:MAG: hypothetical protein M1831_000554 [Alyxoria varia]|nr:MAG: hypothetical protein M1831_000554 [Alyxoria varia]